MEESKGELGMSEENPIEEFDLDDLFMGGKEIKHAEERAKLKEKHRAIKEEARDRKRAEKKKRYRQAVNARKQEELKKMNEEEKEARRQKELLTLERLTKGKFEGRKLVIDLDYKANLAERQLKSLALQISRSVSCLKNFGILVSINLTSVSEELDSILKSMGSHKWACQMHKEDFNSVFSKREKGKLIYLSPDSQNVLKGFDEEDVLVIGGIIDTTVEPGLSLNKAEQMGIESAQLPLEEFGVTGRKSLNVCDVVMILAAFMETGSWEKAIKATLPQKYFEKQSKNH